MKSKDYLKHWMQKWFPEFSGVTIMADELVYYRMWERFRDYGGYARIPRKLKKRVNFVEWDFIW